MTPKSSELRELLRERAGAAARDPLRPAPAYKNFEAFVLEYGRAYESTSLERRERALVARALREHRNFWKRGFEYSQCFVNAQELLPCDKTGALVYVEGFVWGYADQLPPVHHGWLSLHGKVIDVTAPTRATPRPPPPEPPQLHGVFEGRVYYGVPFLRRYLRERSEANLGWGSLLDDEQSGQRLLVHGGAGAVRQRR